MLYDILISEWKGDDFSLPQMFLERIISDGVPPINMIQKCCYQMGYSYNALKSRNLIFLVVDHKNHRKVYFVYFNKSPLPYLTKEGYKINDFNRINPPKRGGGEGTHI